MPMKLLKFAAIDIGSNAVRLLLTNVIEDGADVTFTKSSLVRMPVRLGVDAFTHGRISELRTVKLIKTMIAFRHLMEVEDVVAYRACATSAMREAANSEEILRRISAEAGIDIEIIDGKREAEIIYANGIAENLDSAVPYLYVDVGGGSTEITYFEGGRSVTSSSFNVGTIRILEGGVKKADFNHMKDWIKRLPIIGRSPKLIGSGGNINKLYKLMRKPEGDPMLHSDLKALCAFIESYSVDERIKILGMNPDRADVIIPASTIFLKVMKWAGAQEVIVPTFGVSDGIVRMLYSDWKVQQSDKSEVATAAAK